MRENPIAFSNIAIGAGCNEVVLRVTATTAMRVHMINMERDRKAHAINHTLAAVHTPKLISLKHIKPLNGSEQTALSHHPTLQTGCFLA